MTGLPKLDLTTFFLSISSSAHMALETGKDQNLELAKQNIDLLELMKEKTAGNRSSDEDGLLEYLLFQIRMLYVEKTKKK